MADVSAVADPATGVAVFTPEIKEIANYRIDPRSIDTIGGGFGDADLFLRADAPPPATAASAAPRRWRSRAVGRYARRRQGGDGGVRQLGVVSHRERRPDG